MLAVARVAYLEVADPGDVLELKRPDQVAVHWLVNPDPDDAAFLVDMPPAGTYVDLDI